jgi:ABC-type glycerol-3-phosphate transport system permease component
MALQVYYLASDVGAHVGRQMAGYTIATIPLLIMFFFFSKQFIEGLTSGALKF